MPITHIVAYLPLGTDVSYFSAATGPLQIKSKKASSLPANFSNRSSLSSEEELTPNQNQITQTHLQTLAPLKL